MRRSITASCWRLPGVALGLGVEMSGMTWDTFVPLSLAIYPLRLSWKK